MLLLYNTPKLLSQHFSNDAIKAVSSLKSCILHTHKKRGQANTRKFTHLSSFNDYQVSSLYVDEFSTSSDETLYKLVYFKHPALKDTASSRHMKYVWNPPCRKWSHCVSHTQQELRRELKKKALWRQFHINRTVGWGPKAIKHNMLENSILCVYFIHSTTFLICLNRPRRTQRGLD